jgi:hypothetical protein
LTGGGGERTLARRWRPASPPPVPSAVDAELASRGVRDLMIGVMEGNDGARRLYESRGLVPGWQQLYRLG